MSWRQTITIFSMSRYDKRQVSKTSNWCTIASSCKEQQSLFFIYRKGMYNIPKIPRKIINMWIFFFENFFDVNFYVEIFLRWICHKKKFFENIGNIFLMWICLWGEKCDRYLLDDWMFFGITWIILGISFKSFKIKFRTSTN